MISSIFHWLIEEKNVFSSSSLLFGSRFFGNLSARPARKKHGISLYSFAGLCFQGAICWKNENPVGEPCPKHWSTRFIDRFFEIKFSSRRIHVLVNLPRLWHFWGVPFWSARAARSKMVNHRARAARGAKKIITEPLTIFWQIFAKNAHISCAPIKTSQISSKDASTSWICPENVSSSL